MVQVANTSRIVQRLIDTAGEVHEIEPGEHANIDVDKDNPHIDAKVVARLIKIGGTEKQAAEAAQAGVVIQPAEPADPKPAPSGRRAAASADGKPSE